MISHEKLSLDRFELRALRRPRETTSVHYFQISWRHPNTSHQAGVADMAPALILLISNSDLLKINAQAGWSGIKVYGAAYNWYPSLGDFKWRGYHCPVFMLDLSYINYNPYKAPSRLFIEKLYDLSLHI